MLLITDPVHFPKELEKGVLTLGNFDGVHLGHQALLKKAREEAQRLGAPAVGCTFHPHPVTLLAPQKGPHVILPLAEKIRALEACGLDALLVLPFTKAFAEQTPEEFFFQVLMASPKPQSLWVGRDFCFGRNRSGTYLTLQTLGAQVSMEVNTIGDVLDGEERVSSSRIRKLLVAGSIREAARLMGRPYVVRGVVVQGDQKGRDLGFPTANLAPTDQMLPLDGIYAAHVETPDGLLHPAATYVGRKPTFQGSQKLVESFLLDGTHDLYGVEIRVLFQDLIRPDKAFSSVEALVAQMTLDVQEARRLTAEKSKIT